ncbi:MAG TPA: acyl-CoA reductase [Bacteroidales bacterium]|jgi:hypothetical protein|nr:acyl-CoA reductase [Bacteroidales bacterium]MDY0161009.1 acyl-CoA reductase [Bacteroidales bacterium]HRW21713.1 acyl-CoA reductase [Bacteroidales bacterium]HXK80922.1 acyl-CoA reductase [Bacteroidales bacterium]
MKLDKRIKALQYIGHICQKALNNQDNNFPGFDNIMYHNPWFTPDNVRFCLNYWHNTLTNSNIKNWLSRYQLKNENSSKSLGLVFAGNIPLVGLHDLCCAIAVGVNLKIKFSSKDRLLPEWIINSLKSEFKELEDKIEFSDNFISDFDAIIATGSNNTSRYFEYYFGKYKHIIRHNRNSIAIISGKENRDTIEKLADDIFLYFGLGCRSISKLYLPSNFDCKVLEEGFQKYNKLLSHNKYANNYDYWKSVYTLDKIKFTDMGFFILNNTESLYSPPSVINYEYYSKTSELNKWIKLNQNSLQCVLSENEELSKNKFGTSQKPALNEYSDNIDTINFLTSL